MGRRQRGGVRTQVARGALLLLGGMLLLVPGQCRLPPVDRDEARFAEASRQMAVADHWEDLIVPRVGGKPRLAKPPLIYWLQSATVRLFGDLHISTEAGNCSSAHPMTGGIIAYRFPSMLAALLTMLVVWRMGRSMFPEPVPWLAALILGCSLVVLVDARQSRTDEVLLLATTVAQWSLWNIWSAHRKQYRPGIGIAIVFWLAVAVGTLVKGPVTPAIAAMTAGTVSLVTRDARWLWHLRPIRGVLLVGVLSIPWMLACAQSVGSSLFVRTIVDEVIGRSVQAKEGHSAPPGYHILLLPFCLWPGCVALAPAVLRLRRALRWNKQDSSTTSVDSSKQLTGRMRRVLAAASAMRAGRSAEFFCLAWIIPGWILFEVVATKLPHYTLPLYPPIALLLARGACSSDATWRRLLSRRLGSLAAWGWIVLSELIAVGLPLFVAVYCSFEPANKWEFAWLGIGLIINQGLVILAAWSGWRQQMRSVLFAGMGMSAVFAMVVFPVLLPRCTHLWISSRLACHIEELDPDGSRPIAAVGYHEDSLLFLLDGRLERIRRRMTTTWVQDHPHGLLIVEGPLLNAIPPHREIAHVNGFNYSKGRNESVTLYELE